jgi:uncharacterized membrane protein YGL010W
MSPALQSHFADYASFHRTRGNQACHYVGIPLIVLSIYAGLGHLHLFTLAGFEVTGAELLLVLVSLYYFGLDLVLALSMLLVSAVLIGAGRLVPVLGAAALFLVGWIFQFAGHYVYEHRSPAFYKNLAHLLVGPLWILAKALGRA